MRKWAYLKEPITCNDRGERIYKIMLYETPREGVYVFEYCAPDAEFCDYDDNYDRLADALKAWEPLIDGSGWHEIADPLPDCQSDAFLPIRVKGRNTGKPVWGQYEILQRGKWVDYIPRRKN